MRHGSLFSGIGGFDLAAKWLGWQNVFQVENDPFCQQILEKNFPFTTRYSDIKDFNAKKYKNKIDIISGGFPCQPWSINGKRKGEKDERHLFPEMLRVIREIRPRFVLGENVAGLIPDQLERCCIGLESEGYEVTPFVIPAYSIGAPHLRRRVWIVAHSTRRRRKKLLPKGKKQNASSTRLASGKPLQMWNEAAPPITTFCGVDDGVPDRTLRLRALGNAIVPPLAYLIFQVIEQFAISDS